MTNDALNSIVVVVAIFALLHYCTLRTLITGRGIFERREEQDDRPSMRIHRP